jgi:diacylglycerol kinase family enzyme
LVPRRQEKRWRPAGDVDRKLMRRWTRRRAQPIDQLLAGLSRAADHSKLWLVLAAVAASFGGTRGRRAAEHGVLALTFTSAIVNGPLKLLIGRRRPPPGRRIRRMPRTPSFPSGHSASAFAFAVAATRELPEAGPLLLPLAASVAYSRVYLGVHYPSDVIGTAARSTARNIGIDTASIPLGSRAGSEAVLVFSPHAGNSRRLGRARRALNRYGVQVAEELAIQDVARLPDLLRDTAGQPRLVIVAGGDGTVGSVAGYLAGADNSLGILPLGTGNDFARSVGIPINPRRAAKTVASGQVSHVDLGCLTRPHLAPTHFAHAATVGLNVDFAKLATRASVRARVGRLTYLVSAAYALRERASFTCSLRHGGVVDELTLLQLSVISAPVIGGPLEVKVKGPDKHGHKLDVLAVEDVSAPKILKAGLFLLLGVQQPVAGLRAMQVESLEVDSERPLGLAMDGELDGTLPGRFEIAARALRVIAPRRS